MKSYKIISSILIGFTLLFNSCSIEKRIHNSGYHITLNNNKVKSIKDKENKNIAQKTEKNPVDNNLTIRKYKSESETKNLAFSKPQIDQKESQELKSNKSKVTKEKTQSFQIAKEEVFSSKDIGLEDRRFEATNIIKEKSKNKENKLRYDTILLVLLAFLLPPLAVYLFEGENWTDRCTLNLILTLLCGLPGLIHALIVILK